MLTKDDLENRFNEIIDGIQNIGPKNFWFWVSGECIYQGYDREYLMPGELLKGRFDGLVMIILRLVIWQYFIGLYLKVMSNILFR